MRLTAIQVNDLATAAVNALAARWPKINKAVWVRTLVAIAKHESNFVTDARNPRSSAQGLMQMLTATRAWVETRLKLKTCTQTCLNDPDYAMRLAAEYLAWLYMNKASQSWQGAIIAYNQGHVNQSAPAKAYLAAVNRAYSTIDWAAVYASNRGGLVHNARDRYYREFI